VAAGFLFLPVEGGRHPSLRCRTAAYRELVAGVVVAGEAAQVANIKYVRELVPWVAACPPYEADAIKFKKSERHGLRRG
jgi:hypothetical protein